MDRDKAPEGAFEMSKEYTATMQGGTEMKIVINATLANLNENDVQEACSMLAQFSRNFYLHMGNEANETIRAYLSELSSKNRLSNNSCE